MFDYRLGDLVVLQETVEDGKMIGIKGEICIIAKVYNKCDLDNGIFFDYEICTADGLSVDVWQGEIKKLEDDEEI